MTTSPTLRDNVWCTTGVPKLQKVRTSRGEECHRATSPKGWPWEGHVTHLSETYTACDYKAKHFHLIPKPSQPETRCTSLQESKPLPGSLPKPSWGSPRTAYMFHKYILFITGYLNHHLALIVPWVTNLPFFNTQGNCSCSSTLLVLTFL